MTEQKGNMLKLRSCRSHRTPSYMDDDIEICHLDHCKPEFILMVIGSRNCSCMQFTEIEKKKAICHMSSGYSGSPNYINTIQFFG